MQPCAEDRQSAGSRRAGRAAPISQVRGSPGGESPPWWLLRRSQLRTRRLGIHTLLGLRQRSFRTCQLRVAHAYLALISASRRNTFFLSVSKRQARAAPLKTHSAAYVSAMHRKELTTSSGPFSAKKLS